jgi:hypothetical protein
MRTVYGFFVAFGAGLVAFVDFIEPIDPDFIDFAEALVAVFGPGVAFEAAIAVPVIKNPAARSAASIFFIGAPPSVATVRNRDGSKSRTHIQRYVTRT